MLKQFLAKQSSSVKLAHPSHKSLAGTKELRSIPTSLVPFQRPQMECRVIKEQRALADVAPAGPY